MSEFPLNFAIRFCNFVSVATFEARSLRDLEPACARLIFQVIAKTTILNIFFCVLLSVHFYLLVIVEFR